MDNRDIPILIILSIIAAVCGAAGVFIHDRMKRGVDEEVSWREGYDTDRGTLERYAPDEVESPDDEE